MYLVFIDETKACFFAESGFFYKVNFRKMNYLSIFVSVMKNKLENNLLMFYFSQVY
jgi:hypothetical protein